jgi:hypothetical protein
MRRVGGISLYFLHAGTRYMCCSVFHQMKDRPIVSLPSDFLQQVMRTFSSTPLLSTPSRHKRHRAPPSGIAPRRSDRLAEKARNRPPAVAAAQNVLMQKLGLASSAHIETADYDRYLELFDQGLSEEQARRINSSSWQAQLPQSLRRSR